MPGGSREGLKIGFSLYSLTAQRVMDLDNLFSDDTAHKERLTNDLSTMFG